MTLSAWDTVAKTDSLALICGAIALVCVMSWPYAASYRKTVAVQSLGAAAFSVQFACLGAWTASATSILSLTQLVCVAMIGGRRCVRAVCGFSIVALIAITILTWHGTPSLLAVCGSLAGSLARVQKSTTRMKIIFVLGAPFWILHNIAVGAIFALCVDAVSVAGNVSSLKRTARRNARPLLDPLRLAQRMFEVPPAATVSSTWAKTLRFGYA
ncbi:YgjV family protein [Sphingomonas floccifaciens]|jgi:hypothetical protein|nr:YgjV family protein [Sphingomonas metalli]